MQVTIIQALDLIYEKTKKTTLKIVPIEEASNHILAQDIVATHNLPPFDNSAMDGYAVKLQDSNKRITVSHTIFAGDNSDEVLKSGNAIKIMTGAKIPDGCECIVPKEDTVEYDDEVTLPSSLLKGKHIRLCGEDIKKGELLLKKGEKLQAYQIAILASQGISHIKVHKKPRIALFASGSELKMHFENLQAHQLYNTNTPTLLARCEELNCEVDFIGTAKDSLDDLKLHIQSALQSDLIITSGGVSVGDADFTKEAFASFGMQTYFDKVEIKPGKPTTFGRIDNTLILNLPGNPLAAALNFELFGQSIILALSGASNRYLNPIQTKLLDDYKIKKGRISLVPGRFNGTSFQPAEKFAPGMVSPLSYCNSYIMVSDNTQLLKKDSIVNIIPIRFGFECDQRVELSCGTREGI